VKVRVRYHGPYRAAAKKDEETLLLDETAVIGDALDELRRKYGASFIERRDGLVCMMERGAPRAVAREDPLYDGALLLFVGTMESG
jgi:molybdopterin converting factor small subunit